MHEYLDFCLTVRTDIADVLQRQLTGQNDTGKAQLLQRKHTRQIMHGHLCARMHGQIRCCLLYNPGNAEILHENSICAGFVEESYIVSQLRELFISNDRIDRHMHMYIAHMCKTNGLTQTFFIEIIRIGSGSEHISCQIDRICSALYRCDQCLFAPCRSQ